MQVLRHLAAAGPELIAGHDMRGLLVLGAVGLCAVDFAAVDFAAVDFCSRGFLQQ